MITKVFFLIVGVAIGLSIPIVVDYADTGTMIPCRTMTRFEDGSRIQACVARN